MLNTLKEKILQINQAAGVEISLLQEGGLLINAVILNLEKNKLVKKNEYFFLKNYDELIKSIGTQLPIAVSLTGKGILIKKIAAEALTANPIEMVLPAANPDEFYFEVSKFESFAFISIIRKEIMDNIIQNLQEKGLKILSVSLGINDVKYINSYLTFESLPMVISTNYSVKFNEGRQVIDVEHIAITEVYNKTEFNIGDQYVRASGIIPFGSAAGLLASNIESAPEISNEMILQERERYKYFKFFKAATWAFLICIFSILILNFIFYNYYFEKNKELQTEQSMTRDEVEKTKLLEENMKKKENFLAVSGWDAPSRLSYFADKIAGMVPLNIQLTSMKIYPAVSADVFENSSVVFKIDTIQINGTCEDPTELSEFTGNLKNTMDFNEVAVKNYSYKKETGIGAFYMEIVVK